MHNYRELYQAINTHTQMHPHTNTAPDFVGTGLQFIAEAKFYRQCPQPHGYEVVITGRSNAGKSTFINCIANNNKLARTSSTPGRTQGLVFFSNQKNNHVLVDLPGYGYAKTTKKLRHHWGIEIEHYLLRRTNLCGLVLVADCRRTISADEFLIVNLAQQRKLPLLIVLTKTDKVNQSQRNQSMVKAKTSIAKYMQDTQKLHVISFSAQKKYGLPSVYAWFTHCYALATNKSQLMYNQ